MKERLLRILNHLGYSATRFADEIDVQRSGISHILSGRNQPSFDFLVKILTRFPEIDAQWLILGTGNMHKAKEERLERKEPPLKEAGGTDLFSSLPVNSIDEELKPVTPFQEVTNVNIDTAGIERVLILKEDGTFDIYQQSKKV
jgi:transcriptional regulator with XRE-family HTH domain